jgi:hypothetical protein
MNNIVHLIDNYVMLLQSFCTQNKHFVTASVIFFMFFLSAVGAKWLAILIALIYLMIKVS